LYIVNWITDVIKGLNKVAGIVSVNPEIVHVILQVTLDSIEVVYVFEGNVSVIFPLVWVLLEARLI
jgi:hypothetical protein